MTSNRSVLALAAVCVLLGANPVEAKRSGKKFNQAAAAELSTTYQRSYSYEAAGNIESALREMDKVSDRDREYVYWLRIGWLQYLAGRHEEAITSYTKAARLERSSIEAKLGMLLPQMTLGKWREAEKTVKEVLKKDRYNLLASQRFAYILYNMGRYAEAEDRYRAVLNLYPADLEMQSGVGWSLLMQGKKEKAAAVFQEILVISPYHAAAKSGLKQAQAR